MDEMARILLRANQILDLPVEAETACFARLASQESDSFVSAVREKVRTARGAAVYFSLPAWRCDYLSVAGE